MKYFYLFAFFTLFSCGNEEAILLPKENITIVKEVVDHSPIYLFFKTNAKDTIVEVNRKNSIISTNWIFNIDKRLPLRLVIPEVMKLQEKKRAEKAHKNEKAQNYYSYADSIGKNLAFLPFTEVYYTLGKPKKDAFTIYFKSKSNFVILNNSEVRKSELLSMLYSEKIEVLPEVILAFDQNMTYQEYISNKILIFNLETSKPNTLPKEFIY